MNTGAGTAEQVQQKQILGEGAVGVGKAETLTTRPTPPARSLGNDRSGLDHRSITVQKPGEEDMSTAW